MATFPPSSNPVVPGVGPQKARWMIVGEAPGREDATHKIPFVGRAGKEQDAYLRAAGLNRMYAYITNLIKEYIEGNPDPTAALIKKWEGVLVDELRRVQPEFVMAVGRFATRWFLGDVDMEAVHGLPWKCRMPGVTVIPCYHPAYGFYDDEARTLIHYDYQQAGRIIRGKVAAVQVEDEYPEPEYYDVGLAGLYSYLSNSGEWREISPDTEGIPDRPWSFQVSVMPGTGVMVRTTDRDFSECIKLLRSKIVEHDATVIVHNGMYDLEMMRVMGLELSDFPLYDTRNPAYILRVEPQALKPLAARHCGMKMEDYHSLVEGAGFEKQVAYLAKVMDGGWLKPESRLVKLNDGTFKVYTPQPVQQRAMAILHDLGAKENVSIIKRWRQVDPVLRKMVEKVLGKMPIGTLDDIPLPKAIYYSCRDADATLRLKRRLHALIEAANLTHLLDIKNECLSLFEEMQYEGMPASRDRFEILRAYVDGQMDDIRQRISHRHYNDRPFNPNSPDQVRAIMRRRGLKGEKLTKKTRKVSTGKKSIEHLRFEDEAMAGIVDWREHSKIRDSFCDPFLEMFEDGATHARIRCSLNPYKVTSGRLAGSDPNLLAIPVRNELSNKVRECFEVAE